MFESNIEILKCDVKNISLKYLIKIVKNTIRRATIIIPPITYNNTAENLKWFYKNKGNKKNSTLKKSSTGVEEQVHNNRIRIITHSAQYASKIHIYNRINNGNT